MASLDHDAVVSANRRYWDELAPHRFGVPADRLRSGEQVLEGYERDLAGDVRGTRLLQLGCSTGDEAIAWSLLGARVSGIDLSAVAIAGAREKAAAVGVDVDLRVGDLHRLPADLTGLDVVAMSWGVICWVTDLDAFFGQLADRLAPGGFVLIAEHHPVWEVLSATGPDTLLVTGDYFSGDTPAAGLADPHKQPVAAHGRDLKNAPQAFVWGVGAVASAALGAGMRIDALRELPGSDDMYGDRFEASHRLPGIYLLKASRTA